MRDQVEADDLKLWNSGWLCLKVDCSLLELGPALYLSQGSKMNRMKDLNNKFNNGKLLLKR